MDDKRKPQPFVVHPATLPPLPDQAPQSGKMPVGPTESITRGTDDPSWPRIAHPDRRTKTPAAARYLLHDRNHARATGGDAQRIDRPHDQSGAAGATLAALDAADIPLVAIVAVECRHDRLLTDVAFDPQPLERLPKVSPGPARGVARLPAGA